MTAIERYDPADREPVPAAAGLAGIAPRYPRLGAIRPGHKVPVIKNGQQATDRHGHPLFRPERLQNWRVTSPDRALVEQVAQLYGGTVQPWGEQFEVHTTTNALVVAVAPDQVITQAWERYKGEECVVRCDGIADVRTGQECACPVDMVERAELAAQDRACKPATRLAVLLPDVEGFGVWQLLIHGYNGAAELAGTYNLMRAFGAAGRGTLARLVLSQRSSKSGGQLKRFTVPMLVPQRRIAEFIPQALPTDHGEIGGPSPAASSRPVATVDAQALTVPQRAAQLSEPASRQGGGPNVRPAGSDPPPGGVGSSLPHAAGPTPPTPPDDDAPLPDLAADATAAEQAFHAEGFTVEQASALLCDRYPGMELRYSPSNLRRLRGKAVIGEHVQDAVKLRAERADAVTAGGSDG